MMTEARTRLRVELSKLDNSDGDLATNNSLSNINGFVAAADLLR